MLQSALMAKTHVLRARAVRENVHVSHADSHCEAILRETQGVDAGVVHDLVGGRFRLSEGRWSRG